MISGTADDRLAFVIETEAKLDAIKQTRAEVTGLSAEAAQARDALGRFSAGAGETTAGLGGLGTETRHITDSTRAMTLMQMRAIEMNKEMGASSVAATKNMSAWSAMQAEAAGHLGEHSLAIGRLEMSLARFAEHATGVNSTVGMLTASLSKFAIGSIETAGILIGIDAIIAVYDKLTESARKTKEEQDKAIESFEKLQREKALGPEGVVIEALGARIDAAREALANPFSRGSVETLKANLAAAQAALADALDERDKSLKKTAASTDQAYAGNLATLVAFNANESAARQAALAEIARYQVALKGLGDAEYAARAEIIGKIKTLEAPFKAEQAKIDEAITRNLARLGGLSRGVDAGAAVEKEQDRAEKAETRGAALHASMQAKILEATLRTEDQVMRAQLAANDAEYMRRQVDIANLDVSETRKTELLRDNANLRVANERQIREAAADKREKAEQAAADKLTRIHEEAARKQLATVRRGVDAIVNSQGSVIDTLRKMALDPIVSHLEGMAADQAVAALASFPDFAAMAAHGAAAAAATVAAHEVASWAGSGTHGGSSASGAGSGGGSGGGFGMGGWGSDTFQPRSSTEGQGSVTIQLYSVHPYGAEQIQELQYQLNRAGVLKRPVPISSTTQLKPA